MPELEEWLEPFPAAIRDSVLACGGPATTVVGPERVTFGARPAASIRWMIATVDLATCATPLLDTMAWLLELGPRVELSVVEAEALFGTCQTVDAVAGAAATDGQSRLVVMGRLRHDVVGLLFGVTETTPVGCFAAVERSQVPVAFLLF